MSSIPEAGRKEPMLSIYTYKSERSVKSKNFATFEQKTPT